MSDLQQLRTEFRDDIRDLKSDLNVAVSRIERTLEHTEAAIMQRMTQQENRIMANLTPIADWRIEVEKRLAVHAQTTRIAAAIFGLIGSAAFAALTHLAACSGSSAPVGAGSGEGSGSGSGEGSGEGSGSGSGASVSTPAGSGSGSGEGSSAPVGAGSGSGSGSGE
jgi:hypothetical protein